MATCVDLKAQFGDRFRITYEESYSADRGDGARAQDPWLLIMPCRYGRIYPHGGDLLGASTDRRGATARALAALPGVRVVQDGSDGINVTFPKAEFEAVAAIMKPKRRRVLTAEQRERLVAIGAKHRFGAARGANDACDDLKSDPRLVRLPEAA
jgi:hypothetical protein